MDVEEIEYIKQIARSLLGWYDYMVEVKGDYFNLTISAIGCETLYYGYFESNKGSDPKMEMKVEYQGKNRDDWNNNDETEQFLARDMERWIATLASKYWRAGYRYFKITVRITE